MESRSPDSQKLRTGKTSAMHFSRPCPDLKGLIRREKLSKIAAVCIFVRTKNSSTPYPSSKMMLTLLKREKTRWKIWSEPIWASQRNSRDWTLCLRVSQENSMISESDIAKLRVPCLSTKVLRLRWETMKTRLDYWQLSCRSWMICWRRGIDRLALWKKKNFNYIAR